MFVRASQMQIQPGSIDAVLGVANQLAAQTSGLAGLQDYILVRIGENEIATIGIWESAAAEEAAGDQLRGALMSSLGQYLAGRPLNWSGEAQSFVMNR